MASIYASLEYFYEEVVHTNYVYTNEARIKLIEVNYIYIFDI